MTANNKVIKGIWVKDQLNGLASVEESGGEAVFVIFKDGMQIHLDKEPLRIWTLLLSITCMIAFYAGIALALILTDPIYFGLLGVSIIYIISACCSDTCKYMNNIVKLETVFVDIGTAIASAPTIKWHMKAYHMETQHYTTTDS